MAAIGASENERLTYLKTNTSVDEWRDGWLDGWVQMDSNEIFCVLEPTPTPNELFSTLCSAIAIVFVVVLYVVFRVFAAILH